MTLYITDFILDNIAFFNVKTKNPWKNIGIYISRSLIYTVAVYLLSINLKEFFFPIFSFSFFLIWNLFCMGWKPKKLLGFVIKNILKIVLIFTISYIWYYLFSEFINHYILSPILFYFYLYSLGFFIAIETGSEFIEILLNECHFSKNQNKQKMKKRNQIDHGKIIGIFERFLICSFTITDNLSAIGIILAAKSVLRLINQEKEKVEAEYIIIGTLGSFSFAFSIGMVIREILKLLNT